MRWLAGLNSMCLVPKLLIEIWGFGWNFLCYYPNPKGNCQKFSDGLRVLIAGNSRYSAKIASL